MRSKMKHFFLAILFLNPLLLKSEFQEDAAETRVRSMLEITTPLQSVHDIADIVRANSSQDYVWVVIKAIDLYDSMIKKYPLPFSSFFVHLFQKFLKWLHPLYVRLFPGKRPKNETMGVGSEGPDFNSFIKKLPQEMPGKKLLTNSLPYIAKPDKTITNASLGIEGTLAKRIEALLF